MDEEQLEQDLLHATLYAQYLLGTDMLLSFVGWQPGPNGDLLTMAIVDHRTQISRQGPIVDAVREAMGRFGYRFDAVAEKLNEIRIVSAVTTDVSAHERLAALARLCDTEKT